jgi:hypothetical protein
MEQANNAHPEQTSNALFFLIRRAMLILLMRRAMLLLLIRRAVLILPSTWPTLILLSSRPKLALPSAFHLVRVRIGFGAPRLSLLCGTGVKHLSHRLRPGVSLGVRIDVSIAARTLCWGSPRTGRGPPDTTEVGAPANTAGALLMLGSNVCGGP